MKIVRELGVGDLFSIANAVSGFLGICALISGAPFLYYLYISTVMDGMDGIMANRFGRSRIGKELDSLADAISFGLFPSLILLERRLLLVGALYLISSILRLARFNVISKEDFVGLPTLASALTISCWIKLSLPFLGVLAVILSVLMISDFEYVRIRDRRALVICGLIVVANAFTIYAVWLLLLMLMAYIASPGVIPLARLISRQA